MDNIRLTLYDELGDEPIKSYLLGCETDIINRAADITSVLNSKKWGNKIDLDYIKFSVNLINKCDLLQERRIRIGGYTGGPLGMSELKYPAVYEHPSDVTFVKEKAEIKCYQDGHHLSCALHPTET